MSTSDTGTDLGSDRGTGASELDRDIAVQPAEHAADGTVTAFEADLSDGWRIGGGLNGGYLLAVLGNAAATVAAPAGHPDPVVVSAHYLSASRTGAARVSTELLRSGGRLTTVAARLEQDGEPRISAQVGCGDLDRLTDDVRTSATVPDLPPLEDCLPAGGPPPGMPPGSAPLLERFDLRADPASFGWVAGRPTGRGMLQGWLRLHDDIGEGRDLDPLALLLAVDCLPPVTFDLGAFGWAPTVELTVHVRARPAPGWAIVRHATRNVAGGFFEEDCEIWDAAGRLVAQSRQLALVPR